MAINLPDIWHNKGVPFGVSKYSDVKSDMARRIAEALPHGSGIDSDWHIEEKGNKIYAYNSYHCMDECGMYCGWQDFYVVIPITDLKNFKLHFQGGQYLAQKYMLRDYLEDTILYALEEIK